MQQMKIIINVEQHKNAMDKWRIELRIMKAEKQKFFSNKEMLLGIIFG